MICYRCDGWGQVKDKYSRPIYEYSDATLLKDILSPREVVTSVSYQMEICPVCKGSGELSND